MPTKSKAKKVETASAEEKETGCCVIKKGVITIKEGGITREACQARAKEEGGKFRFFKGKAC